MIKKLEINMVLYICVCVMSFVACVRLFGGSRRVLLGLPRSNSNFNSRGGRYSKEKYHGDLYESWDLYLVFRDKLRQVWI